jgi:hypothetical protein
MFYNKTNPYHDWRIIDVPVDFGYVEGVLQKCDRVNKAIEQETPPKKICEPFWCKTCPFESICLPELEVEGVEVKLNESPEFEELVYDLMRLKPYFAEYNDALKQVKSHLVKGQDLITKAAVITWKKSIVNCQAKSAYSYEKHYPVFQSTEDR